jgi:hypothetical protein
MADGSTAAMVEDDGPISFVRSVEHIHMSVVAWSRCVS